MTPRPWWRRKRWWAAAALLWMAVAYVLSYGIANRVGDSRPRASTLSRGVHHAAGYVFWPLDMTLLHGPKPARDALAWYIDLWLPADGSYGSASD